MITTFKQIKLVYLTSIHFRCLFCYGNTYYTRLNQYTEDNDNNRYFRDYTSLIH